jgi:hypothetical protein
MRHLSEILEEVINSPEVRKMFLSVELKHVMNKKYSEPIKTKSVSKKDKKYRLVITVESIEEL